MVGLVIVSHSRTLADALVQLIGQIAPTGLPIAVAAGIGDNRQEFGTDAVEISQAIQSVFSQDGVVVIMDLGSAILSAEMALDLLPQEMTGHICFCPAPLVEGSLAAAIQIGLGSNLDTVCREAEQSLYPKVEHLTGEASSPTVPAPVTSPPAVEAPGQQLVLTLKNQHGLHARPAARFVQTAAKFHTTIQVTNLTTGKGPVSATSLNALATLGAVRDHQIKISASGPEGPAALDALRQLIEDNFGEAAELERAVLAPVNRPAATEAQPAAGVDQTLQAIPVSEGIALGPFYHYQPAPPPIPQNKAENIQSEKHRLEKAIEQTRQAIERRYQQLKNDLGEGQAAIFEAHLLILQDPDLLNRIHQRIADGQENAAVAWSAVLQSVADSYRALPDLYQQQRAADVMDISNQVLFALAGQADPTPIEFKEPVILFAQEITPTETAQLDMRHVLGILTVSGGPTSHSAILARALSIPAVTGVPPSLSRVKPGTQIAIDGFSGEIQVDPSPEIQQEMQVRRQEWIAKRQRLIETSHQSAATQDGRRIEVFANAGNVIDAQAAVQNGAEGIGLLRTEFLFLTHQTPPTEAEQLEALREIGTVMGDRPVTIRTLDVGGDKQLPYLDLPEEANPFLGVRAIRLSFHHPDLFLTQLRAILRAGEHAHFRIMFPMIANLAEIRQAKSWLEKAHLALLAEKTPHAWPVETGMMIEIPSAALLSPAFAHEVDFFSIGTNDLTQYTLAAERGNPMLSEMADALHPAVLRLIKEVASAAHQVGKWAGVCGELAGDPQATAVLVGLGVDELSLNPGNIPLIKTVLRKIDTTEAAALAGQALKKSSPADVRALAQTFLIDHIGESVNDLIR